jgi:predicted RecA/RadA family phage recombinase
MSGIAGGIVEFLKPGDDLTFTVEAGQSVVGGRLVENSGNMECQPAGANSVKVVGVAAHNAAAGEKVTVFRVGVFYLTASGAINAGDLVEAGAAGVAVAHVAAATEYGQVVGIALEAISDGATGRVALRLG